MHAKRRLVVGAVLALVILMAGCGNKSGVEGKVVDGQGKPLSAVKVVATQVQPLKGYEHFEAFTCQDGSFTFKKLFPSSKYILKPWSDNWTTEISSTVESGPQGETSMLTVPITIRYTVSKDGVIADSATGLEWYAGPDKDTNWNEASSWVSGLSIAGGGWRMPSRAELRSLFQKDMEGECKIDPVFKLKVCYVWSGEQYNDNGSPVAWVFYFGNGIEGWPNRDNAINNRACAVRPHK